jgi:hypothetical protein
VRHGGGKTFEAEDMATLRDTVVLLANNLIADAALRSSSDGIKTRAFATGGGSGFIVHSASVHSASVHSATVHIASVHSDRRIKLFLQINRLAKDIFIHIHTATNFHMGKLVGLVDREAARARRHFSKSIGDCYLRSTTLEKSFQFFMPDHGDFGWSVSCFMST